MAKYILPAASLCAWIFFTEFAVGQQPGDHVVIIADKTEIKLTGGGEVIDAQPGAIFVVAETQGDRVSIQTGSGVGSVPKRAVIPLNEAVNHWSAQIRSKPRDARGYIARGATYLALKNVDKAVADFNEAIRLGPKSATSYFHRGNAFATKGDHDKAVADFSEAIRLDPKLAAAYLNRGNSLKIKGDVAKQISDYNESIRLDPRNSLAYYARAQVREDQGDVVRALADYDESIRLNPQFASAYNNRAWILATNADAAVRDGKRAVESATKLCELDGWENCSNLDTLAAAYAEAGDYASAMKWQAKAVEVAPAPDKADLQTRVVLYRMMKPYHEPPKK
jgi:tetratricopeptide (TPR) repeat protein